MSALKNGMGHRLKATLSDCLAFNTSELTWIALMIGGVLFIGLLF